MNIKMNFYFIRHGETDWNHRNVFQGHNDIPLNENGRKQAQQRKVHFLTDDNLCYFSSPLSRALETAQIVTGLESNIQILPEMMESNSPETAQYLLNKKGVTDVPCFKNLDPNGAKPDDYLKIIKEGLLKMQELSKTMTPVLFAHGGTCTAICEILGVDFFRTPNCSMFFFENNGKAYSAQAL